MKNFKNFLNEDSTMKYLQTKGGIVDVDSEPVRDNINMLLSNVTSVTYLTPYHALEMVRKALAGFHISLPATNFLEGDSGYESWTISQFGDKLGMTDDGQVKVKSDSEYHIYFEYQLSSLGKFVIFCELVNDTELGELLNDVNREDIDNTPEPIAKRPADI